MDNLEILDNILLGENVKDNFKNSLKNKAFASWIYGILPEIKECASQGQNNPWHIYNVLDHILVSVDKMNEQTKDMSLRDRRLLAYTMFLHDIAKPKCHIERVKNGKKIDSFFANGGHAMQSAKVAQRAYVSLGFDKRSGAKLVKLVEDHDIFMNLTLDKTSNPHLKMLTPEVVEHKVDELNTFGDGVILANMLVKVGRADSSAQNPKMTASAFAIHDKFEQIVDSLTCQME